MGSPKRVEKKGRSGDLQLMVISSPTSISRNAATPTVRPCVEYRRNELPLVSVITTPITDYQTGLWKGESERLTLVGRNG